MLWVQGSCLSGDWLFSIIDRNYKDVIAWSVWQNRPPFNFPNSAASSRRKQTVGTILIQHWLVSYQIKFKNSASKSIIALQFNKKESQKKTNYPSCGCQMFKPQTSFCLTQICSCHSNEENSRTQVLRNLESQRFKRWDQFKNTQTKTNSLYNLVLLLIAFSTQLYLFSPEVTIIIDEL